MNSVGSEAFKETIESINLPEQVADLATKYDRQIGIRSDFVWRWMYSLLPAFRLSCVSETHQSKVREQKTILTIFITTLDDTAEHENDKPTFEQARNIPFPDQPVDSARSDCNETVLTFASDVWQVFEQQLQGAPRYDEFIDLFRFDVRQTINAMDYSRVVSEQPDIGNLTGAYNYNAHNMVMFPYADIDLMYSPSFDRSDLALLRETLWELQQLARIGNWVTTWNRELDEGDYSSGVIIAALQEELIDPTDLTGQMSESDREQCITRINTHDIESRFTDKWKASFDDLRDRSLQADSVDLNSLVEGMETVFEYHRASQGLK